MLQGGLEGGEHSGDVGGGSHDAGGDGCGGVEAGDEVEEELGGGVADDEAVGVGAAEKLVGEFKVFVNFGDGGAARGALGSSMGWPKVWVYLPTLSVSAVIKLGSSPGERTTRATI